MVKISDKMIFSAKNLILVLLTIQITACTGQEYEDIVSEKCRSAIQNQLI